MTTSTITTQVKHLKTKTDTALSTRHARDLLEALQLTTGRGPVHWEDQYIEEIVDIFETHPVSPFLKTPPGRYCAVSPPSSLIFVSIRHSRREKSE